MSEYQNGPLKIKPPESDLLTWRDYSMRLKGDEISLEEQELFVQKYWGFVIEICHWKRWNLNEQQITDIIEIVFRKFFESKRFKYNTSFGENDTAQANCPKFRPWFSKIVSNTIYDYLRKEQKNKSVSIENIENFGDDNNLWTEEIESEEAFWNDCLAMLAWEDAVERSKPIQIMCFNESLRGKKPAEIAETLDIKSTQVSEHIRAFKNKLKSSFRNLDEKYNIDSSDWLEIKQKAAEVRQKYDAIMNSSMEK